MKIYLHYLFKAKFDVFVCFSTFVLWFERKEKRRIHNQLLFGYLHSSASTEVYRWNELGERELDRGTRGGDESRGKEKEAEKNPKKAFAFSQAPISVLIGSIFCLEALVCHVNHRMAVVSQESRTQGELQVVWQASHSSSRRAASSVGSVRTPYYPSSWFTQAPICQGKEFHQRGFRWFFIL